MDTHPLLKNLIVLNMWTIITTPETSIKFCEELGLIPRKDGECPLCPNCHNSMKPLDDKKYKLRWVT